MEYAALRIAAALFMVMPHWLFYRLMRAAGIFAFDVLRLRRAVTLDNLRLALGGEYGEDELIRIARESYVNIGTTFAEIAINARMKPHIREIVDLTAITPLREAFEQGRGVIMLTCHYGSWEYAGYAVAEAGMPLTAVGKTQSNPMVDRFLISQRERMDIGVVAKGAQVKELVKRLRRGEVIALVSDQDAGRRGIMVPFFGHPASTPSGAASLALKYNAPVVVNICERTAPGAYTLLCHALPYDEYETVESLTTRMNEAVEQIIRRHPEQYFWMHKRWKTQPPDSNTSTAETTTALEEAS